MSRTFQLNLYLMAPCFILFFSFLLPYQRYTNDDNGPDTTFSVFTYQRISWRTTFNIFYTKGFPLSSPVSLTPLINIDSRISPRIFEKILNGLMVHSGARGKKVWSSKSRVRLPLSHFDIFYPALWSVQYSPLLPLFPSHWFNTPPPFPEWKSTVP